MENKYEFLRPFFVKEASCGDKDNEVIAKTILGMLPSQIEEKVAEAPVEVKKVKSVKKRPFVLKFNK